MTQILILLSVVVSSAVAMVVTLLWVLHGMRRKERAMATIESRMNHLSHLRLEWAKLDTQALKDQMVRECDERDAKINALRADLRELYDAIGELRNPGQGGAPVVNSAAIEDLQEITTWVWPGTDYASNGQAGDGDLFCRGCGEIVADPHRWDQCARVLLRQVNAHTDAMIDRDVAELCKEGGSDA